MNAQNPVPEIIRKKIRQLETTFVFPTQTSANMWADWTVMNTDAKSVPSERFIAWDDFKGEAIKSKQQDKRSVPSAMRSIFSADLIKKNASEKFLSYLITKEYAESAGSFMDYIASILPPLSMWKEKFDAKKISPDEEDKDYLEIYGRYKAFLDAHSLFDPAWETPPFDAQGKKFVIFFPEIIMDYLEYKEILESADEIEIIHVPALDEKPEGKFYSNSRTELRQICLMLRKSHDEKKIKWQDMALSTFDLETWWPYIDREMNLYGIPHVKKNGSPLTQSSAGNFFMQIQNCTSQNFSFESIKTLILNTSLPWTDFKLNQDLIRFGQENNCLCSFGKDYDVWEKAFESPVNSAPDQRIVEMYHALKNILTSMTNAESFEKIRSYYFTFRLHFFDAEKFTEESDRIISRCISELSSLIDLENDFPDCKLSDCYSFFVDYISGKNYVPQTENEGVQILPYRLSAPAPFKIQAVIDSSQASLSVVYRQLAFLSDEKRLELGFTEESNVSELFIRLYHLNGEEESIFTAAEKTFTGYAITSAYLEETDMRKEENALALSLDGRDMYISEKETFLQKEKSFPEKITPVQKKGFSSWKKMQDMDGNETPDEKAVKKLHALIDQKLLLDGKVKIDYSRLKSFYNDCNEFMSHYVLNLDEETNAADLMPPFLLGNFNHKILEIYCKSLAEKNLPLKINENGFLDEEYLEILKGSIKTGSEILFASALSRELFFSSMQNVEDSMLATVIELSDKFSGFEIHAVERSYVYEPEGKQYFFSGKVDCILKEPLTGECVLIDFKSTKNAVPLKKFFVDEETPVPDFQMPMYIYLLENQKLPVHIENCAFFDIKEPKLYPVTGDLAGAKKTNDIPLTKERFLSLADFYAQKVLAHDIDSCPASEEFIKKFIGE